MGLGQVAKVWRGIFLRAQLLHRSAARRVLTHDLNSIIEGAEEPKLAEPAMAQHSSQAKLIVRRLWHFALDSKK